jgi:DNA polymerase I-like protein with 3'-5' exonuclease and polymerase domains
MAHNVYFDGAWLYRECGQWLNWQFCTYGLYMHCANEGFPGQKWGLKSAQIDMLGWTETNETELDAWLVSNGYVNGSGGPLKGEMWRAPMEILGRYCALDADSTWQLWQYVLRPVIEKFPVLQEYHQRDFLAEVLVLIEQKMHGILIDRPQLVTVNTTYIDTMGELENEFQNLPEVQSLRLQRQRELLEEHDSKEPHKFKNMKLGEEPQRLTRKGEVSRNWLKWDEKRRRKPMLNKSWVKWNERRELIADGRHPDIPINIQSVPQLIYLLHTHMRLPVIARSEETGNPVIDDSSLRQLGPVGSLISRYRETAKLQGYVSSYIELLGGGDVLRPSFRVPGTLTGRLSGKDPNIQQIPKVREIMETFIPRDGHVYVDCDHTSIENVVLAELSRDSTLLRLYGPEANPNHDAYLYIGSYLPVIGDAILATGYDPENPTAESKSKAKKEAKWARDIAKVVVLSSSYGAGAGKIHATLESSGVDVSFYQVKKIHEKYWQLFSGIKEFERLLTEEWRENGGWVLNGLGRPICVAEALLKDIVNRVVQSTGHDIHMRYIRILDQIFSEMQLPVNWIIADFHDQSIVEVPIDIAEVVRDIMGVEAYSRLNAELGGLIPLKGEAQIVRSLAEAKLT